MEVTQITSKVIHLEYRSQEELCAAFLRFQEHYESPEFRGKVFTLGQFHDWYSREKGGATYTRDWGGFNIPSYVLDPFIKGLFDPLTKAEEEIIGLFRYRTDKFYLIGTYRGGGSATLDHEICHGLFYTCEDYCADVLHMIEPVEQELEPLRKHLKNLGYCDEVMLDEFNAYIATSTDYLDAEGVEYEEELHRGLNKLFQKYLTKEKRNLKE